jgi:hypothetical protein
MILDYDVFDATVVPELKKRSPRYLDTDNGDSRTMRAMTSTLSLAIVWLQKDNHSLRK